MPVLFDLDGTLIDSLPSITKAVNRLLASHGLPELDSETVTGFVGRGERVLMERLIAATALDAGAFEALLGDFIPIYQDVAQETVLMPGAAEAMDELAGSGVPLGLVTNKPRAPLIPTLQAVGLSDRFDVVVAGDDLAKRKPDPAPIQHAMAELGASRCIYVGDSEVDAETAEAAGQPFVLYTEGIRSVPVTSITSDAAFNDFSELPAICRSL